MTSSKLGTDTQTGQIVELPQAARRQGLYIIGANGTGKTGLIENLILQDIDQGLGVGLLDPHGDLTNAILAKMTKRVEDVILLDLANYNYPFGLNLFTCSDPTNLKIVSEASSKVMHIFKKLWGKGGIVVDDAWGVLLEEILRNATMTLLEYSQYEEYTMAEIPLLLEDAAFRNHLVQKLTFRYVKNYWLNKYNRLSDKDQLEERRSTLNRLNAFLTQPIVENIVGQTRTTLDFRYVMDERKILLVMLDSRMEDVTSLIGSMIIAEFLDAAYSRANIPVNKRKQFNLYADEFQRFATEDFATLLTEARKFGIGTTIAHQARYQPGITDGIRAVSLQAANFVVFRVTSPDADELKGEFPVKAQLGEPVLEQITKRAGEWVTRVYWEPPEAEKEFEEANKELFVDLEPKVKLFGYSVLASNGSSNKEEDIQIDRDWEIISKRIFNHGRYRQEDARLIELYPTRYRGRMYIDFVKLVHVFSHLLTGEEQDAVTRMVSRRLYPLYVRPFCDEHWLSFLWENIYKHAPQRYLIVDHYPKPIRELFYVPPHQYYSLPADIPTFWEQDISEMGHYYAGQLGGALAEFAHKAVDEFLLEVTSVLRPIKAKIAHHLPPAKLNGDRLEFHSYVPRAPVSPDFFLWVRKYVMQLDKRLVDTVEKIEQLKSCRKEKLEFIDFGYELPDREIIGYTRWGDPQEIPRYRMKPGPPRPIADVQNELAITLTNLPLYTARVKIISNNGTVEHTIKTIAPGQGIGKTALDQRKATIQSNNIRDRYVREREDVEKEIAKRQAGCSSSPPVQPQQPRQQPKNYARQVPLQGKCPHCNVSNPPGAKFCNQCGTKL
jgi:hypothetical protein